MKLVCISGLISGVSARRTSLTGAWAVTISDTGEPTSTRCPSSPFQRARMESESLPTGMLMPSSMHRRLAASTAA